MHTGSFRCKECGKFNNARYSQYNLDGFCGERCGIKYNNRAKPKRIDCPTCGGKGETYTYAPNDYSDTGYNFGGHKNGSEKCKTCRGKGTVKNR